MFVNIESDPRNILQVDQRSFKVLRHLLYCCVNPTPLQDVLTGSLLSAHQSVALEFKAILHVTLNMDGKGFRPLSNQIEQSHGRGFRAGETQYVFG